MCFGLESRGTPLPLGFFRVQYCLVVGEEGFLCDRVQTLPAFDVGAEYEVQNEREARALDMCLLQKWIE